MYFLVHQKTQQQRKLPTSLKIVDELFKDNEYDKMSSVGKWLRLQNWLWKKLLLQTEYYKTVSPSNSCDSPDSSSSLLSSNTSSANCNQSKTRVFHEFNVGKDPLLLRSISRSKLKIFLATSLVFNIVSFISICILFYNRNNFKSCALPADDKGMLVRLSQFFLRCCHNRACGAAL
jgi:hypothetical protein